MGLPGESLINGALWEEHLLVEVGRVPFPFACGCCGFCSCQHCLPSGPAAALRPEGFPVKPAAGSATGGYGTATWASREMENVTLGLFSA